MRRDAVVVVMLLAGLTVGTTSDAQPLTGTLDKVRRTGTLTLGYREQAFPFSFTGSDGKPTGYSVELCQEIAADVQRELKLPSLNLRWVPVTPENRIDAVTSGAVDIECGITTASLSRQQKVDFTLMTFIDGGSLMVVEGRGIGTAAELGGKRVAVAPGTTTEAALGAFLRQQSIAATVVPVKDHDEGLAALEAGRVEAYASDRVILIGLALRARGTTRFSVMTEPLSYEPYAFMVRQDDSAFRFVANRTLARTYRSGAVGTLYAKWFGALGRPAPTLLVMYAIQGLPE